MGTAAMHRSLTWFVVVAALTIAGIAHAQVHADMDLKVTFSARWYPDINSGGLVVQMGWTSPPMDVRSFKLYADGGLLATVSGSKRGGSGFVLLDFFWSTALFEEVVDEYLAASHTYRVVAVAYSGSEMYDEVSYVPPDVLTVENHISGFKGDQTKGLSVWHVVDANEGIDDYDELSQSTGPAICSTVISVVREPLTHASYGLARDARPKGSVGEIDLRVGLESLTGAKISFPAPTDSSLVFVLPRQRTGYDFRGRPITVQQYDPRDPTVEYPIYDVRRLLGKTAGVLPLLRLQGSYESGVPYAFFTLSFTREASTDLTRDKVLNLRDFAALAKGWKQAEKPTVIDIAGRHGMGVPDGNVNGFDLKAFCRDWAGTVEGFESGGFDDLGWIGEGSAYWKVVSSESHSGGYCAQAGEIADNQRSRLMITIECRAGEIRFWRKVSSEARYDFLRLRSGGTVLGEWSGELDWERVSFSVEAGVRTFSWEYAKDSGGSMGSDTAWIDLVSFPTSVLSPGRP
jgi:hypothetical protein